MIYPIISHNDGNNTFHVEADNSLDAAYKALDELGWFVAKGEEGTLNEDGSVCEEKENA